MANNLVKNNEQPLGLELGVQSMDAQAASGNLKAGLAYEAPMENNRKREAKHLGNMPNKGDGQF